jgi:hypothetical protein
MLPVSLDFPFLIVRSVFSSVYLLAMEIEQQLDKTNSLKLNISTDVKKCKKEELLILHEHLGSPPVFSGVCVAHIFSFCGSKHDYHHKLGVNPEARERYAIIVSYEINWE